MDCTDDYNVVALWKKSNVDIANNVRGPNFESVKSLETDFAQGVSKNKTPELKRHS